MPTSSATAISLTAVDREVAERYQPRHAASKEYNLQVTNVIYNSYESEDFCEGRRNDFLRRGNLSRATTCYGLGIGSLYV